MIKAIVLCCSLLILFSTPIQESGKRQPAQTANRLTGKQAGPGRHQNPVDNPVVIKALICAYALEYDVEPAFAMAVAHVESRLGLREFRTGLMGRTYYGPMGIHRCFLKKWSVDDPEVNILVGVRALRGLGHDTAKQKRRLRRYNASFNPGYWRAVLVARAKYRKVWR